MSDLLKELRLPLKDTKLPSGSKASACPDRIGQPSKKSVGMDELETGGKPRSGPGLGIAHCCDMSKVPPKPNS